MMKMNYLWLAIKENPKLNRTDIIGIACQYSSNPKLKREDFNELLQMKICDFTKKVLSTKNQN